MSEKDLTSAILIVDDTYQSRLALELTLADLGCEVVSVGSGAEALERTAARDFAVVLMDVKMPGMSGLETARRMRNTERSHQTPIIFVTAFADDIHTFEGYSLGAVDYIAKPIISNVLRTKVGVFIALADKTAQASRQATLLARRAAQFERLTRASMAIHTAMSVDDVLAIVTATAREVMEADEAHAILTGGQSANRAYRAVSRGEGRSGDGTEPTDVADIAGILGLFGSRRSVRLHWPPVTAALGGNGSAGPERLTPRQEPGIGATLASRDGETIGAILVTGKARGEFDADDEAILRQLAQITSIAMDHSAYSDAREAAHAKDEFVAKLSHELRTPLHSMLGWLQLIGSGSVTGEEAEAALRVIERNARFQSRMIEDLLDVSRIAGRKVVLEGKAVALRPILTAIIESLRPEFDAKGVSIKMEDASTAEAVVGEARRLEQVFWNLLSNAVKFTPAGGTVRVSVEDQGECVHIRVSDNGIGIPSSHLERVFDRFQQVDSGYDRAHTGLGIGLTIVRHLVELHGGRVWAESDGPGCGSTFTVTLPRVQAGGGAAEGMGGGSGESMGQVEVGRRLTGMRVLLVDNEADSREFLAMWLRRCGASVETAESAGQAIRAIDREAPHLMITDIAMPGRDGYALIRDVRAREAESGGKVPIMVLSAYAQPDGGRAGPQPGYQRYIAKPVELDDLLEAIVSLAGDESGPSTQPFSQAEGVLT